MKKQIASLDTSFWINAYRVGIIHEVTEYFDIYVAENVADEIRRPLISGREALDASLFNKYLEDKRLHIKNPKKAVPLFGPGEREAIGLAQELKSILLIDDSRPYFYARSQGIKVVASIRSHRLFFRPRPFIVRFSPGEAKNGYRYKPTDKRGCIICLNSNSRN